MGRTVGGSWGALPRRRSRAGRLAREERRWGGRGRVPGFLLSLLQHVAGLPIDMPLADDLGRRTEQLRLRARDAFRDDIDERFPSVEVGREGSEEPAAAVLRDDETRLGEI